MSLEDIYEIHDRAVRALLTTTNEPAEREVIENSPFGGVHVLFTGDFGQPFIKEAQKARMERKEEACGRN